MKLRNKKTGEILRVGEDVYIRSLDSGRIEVKRPLADGNMYFYYDSLSEFFKELEDYKPKEPLIKDEKIRKVVRAWAEANVLERDFEVRYSSNSFSLISWQVTIEFNAPIDGLEHNRRYTIEELCGEEE